MTDDPNFLPEILARPHDDGPRLIYADFLDDKGEAESAAPYLMGAQFRRGFVSRVILTSKPNKPATYLERLFDRCPIDGLALLQYTLKDLESVLKIAGPRRLGGLELLYFNEHLLRPVVAAKGLEDVGELVLNFCQDQSFDVAGALLREPVFRALRILTLRGCHVDDESLDRLLVHPMLANVERLTFERCQLRTPSAKTILDRLNSTKLEWLDLSDNAISGRAASSLSSRFGNLLQMRNREFFRPELFHH
jgi:uncharacterized protein (TIGR02996 family)